MRRTRVFALTCLALTATLVSAPRASEAQSRDTHPNVVTSPDNLIVPSQRIGAIRLSMGMDEVQSMLGKPSGWVAADNAAGIGPTYFYESLNLAMTFSSGAAPSVIGIRASGWTRGRKTIGNTYWKDIKPVNVSFKTVEGITIGSSAFDVVRAYKAYEYQDRQGLMMIYKGLGLTFFTTMDHMVYGIGIYQPQ